MHSCCSGPQISIIYNHKQHQQGSGADEVTPPGLQRTIRLTSGSLECVSTLPTIFGQLDNLKKIIRDIRAQQTVPMDGHGKHETTKSSRGSTSPQMGDIRNYSGDGVDILDILNELNCVNDYLQQLLQRV